jgi:hypothetical protein
MQVIVQRMAENETRQSIGFNFLKHPTERMRIQSRGFALDLARNRSPPIESMAVIELFE